MSKKDKKSLSLYTFTIGAAIYRVYYIEEGIQNGFKKGNAYVIETDLGSWVLPMRDFVKKLSQVPYDAEPGIYVNKETNKHRIIYPTVREAQSIYNPERVTNIIKDVIDNTKFGTNNFVDTQTQVSGVGEVFQPPVREGDDAMNAIVKTAISLKQVPFSAYVKKLEYNAVGLGTGTDGINVRNNSKKSLRENTRMSTGKAVYYCDSFDLRLGIVVTDAPNAPNPMFNDGSMLVIFPNGEFEIDPSKMIKVSEIQDNKDVYFGMKREDPEDVDIYDI